MQFNILCCILFTILSPCFGPYFGHLQGYVLITRRQLLTVSPSLRNN